MKRIFLIWLLTVSALAVSAETSRPVVTIETSMGEIVVELFNETPLHRDNFLRLVDEHVYDSLLFHRVISGFMIQAGDTQSKQAAPGVLLGDSDLPYQVPAEIRVDQGIVHHRGVLAAAREGDDTNPERASSSTQFYITQKDVHRLDGKYTIFGRVLRGMEVVDAIASVATDRNDRPLEDIRILSTSYEKPLSPEEDTSAFVLVGDVIPDAILEIRYYSTFNFIGDRIPGYNEPIAILTRQAADSLRAVSDELRAEGYVLKIYDAYRPQSAVDYFMQWAEDTTDVRMKPYFYPEVEKSVIVPEGYVARRSSHTRGSTVDLTLYDIRLQRDVDMGCWFDYFGLASHPTMLPGQEIGAYPPLNEEQYRNRMILREAMLRHGFKPYDYEWWHFTLANEPFPDTYFTFPVQTNKK